MGMSHHGDGRAERELSEIHELRKRFLEQVEGKAKREYSAGFASKASEGK